MSLVAHYPDRKELVSAMIELALEELTHFQQVNDLIATRGLTLAPDTKDGYVAEMRKLARGGTNEYLLDRLLIAGAIEARGCERFGLLAEHLPESDLKNFYLDITRSEARHHGLFVRIARHYFDTKVIEKRLEEILSAEAVIVAGLPLRAAVH